MELLKLLQRGVHNIGRGEMSNRKKFVGGNIYLHLLYLHCIHLSSSYLPGSENGGQVERNPGYDQTKEPSRIDSRFTPIVFGF